MATDPDAPLALPEHQPPALRDLAERARGYAEAASLANTRRAYAADWKHFAGWCRREGLEALSPDPQVVGLYITACASGAKSVGGRKNAVSTIERRLSALVWACAQRGFSLDRRNPHVATVLAGIRNSHAAPPRQKEAILPEDLLAMLETCDRSTLRGLRDRAMLLIGFAGGLRRSEIVGLDHGKDDTPESGGWVEVLDGGALINLRGKTGWREVEIARGSSDQTCPIHALTQWLHYAKIDFGPIFVAVSRNGLKATADCLSDKHVARLIKQTVEDAGLRPDLSKAERLALYSGYSLRAGLASSAEVDERYVQKQLGHASTEMTRRYRFRVNLTKAAGL
ncbi:MAG: tyrosine-type recombinase/integrase [Gemmobacter sp.]|jgi:integrase|nr:tyrosine-type recombinase/integrase [Gemmobacter sp.]